MSHSSRRVNDLQQVFVRQSVILRDNLHQLDQRLLSGDGWQSLLGRLNAAANQALYVDQGIEDVLDHFAVEPKRCLANPSDVPIFLSTRIVDEVLSDVKTETEGYDTRHDDVDSANNQNEGRKSSSEHLYQYERNAAKFAREFQQNIVRF